ncbi:MAG: hypothetical protein HY064_16975 [Bacteroidetes bacterium]|nr:hypothetical protein [Bacteroidota bacterium]
MKKITLFIIFSLAILTSSAQRGFDHARFYRNNGQHQHFISESNGFSAYGNQYGVSGGPTLELGYGFPVINLHNQFFLLADACIRGNAIKKATVGFGGSASFELRIYDRPRQYSKYGFDFSYGVNAMLFGWSDDDGDESGFGILYGENWFRAGYLKDGHSVKTDENYFMEFQYWNGNLFMCAGIEFDTFSKPGHAVRKKRLKF